jgi:hypothetical protein
MDNLVSVETTILHESHMAILRQFSVLASLMCMIMIPLLITWMFDYSFVSYTEA